MGQAELFEISFGGLKAFFENLFGEILWRYFLGLNFVSFGCKYLQSGFTKD